MTSVVVATVTHDNLPGLQNVVGSLVRQRAALDAEVLVVANDPPPKIMEWLGTQRSTISVNHLPVNVGPGAGRNAVLSERPLARTYIFVDDDVMISGNELQDLLDILNSDDGIALATGVPTTETGERLASAFDWRPLGRVFPSVWESWWGSTAISDTGGRSEADRVSASLIAVRGTAARAIGGFDPMFWPGCHEDTDFCARLRFAGYRIVVDRRLEIRQKVSVTTRKVLGARHLMLCRSTGVIYAAMDYPATFAFGRLAEAALRCIAGPRSIRTAEAVGLIRCAENWRHILRRRVDNSGLRRHRQRQERALS